MNDRKIVICHIAHRSTGKADGVFNHLIMIIKLLDKNRFKNILCYSGNDEHINSLLKSLGVDVYNLENMNKKFSVKLFYDLFTIIKKEKVDIIQAHLVKPYLFAGIVNLLLKRKLVFNYHGAFIESTFYSSLERFLLNLIHKFIVKKKVVHRFIFPSNQLMNQIKSQYAIDVKCNYYYNGFFNHSFDVVRNSNISLSELNELKQKFFLVGIIGRIDKWKRIDIALKVLALLIQKKLNFFFVFIGDGDLINQMKKLANDLEIQSYVKFYDFIPEVKNKLGFFDVILFTSEKEGLPLVIWEAMYNSVPIVSSDVGGIREILEGEKCGIVYPFGDIEKCADILAELYHDRQKLIELGVNGRKAVQEKYNQKQFIDFFENLYSELVDEK
jgi:glycosyltransferase involved in cell wall biosynthesis